MAKRLQLRRTKGWRLPPGAVNVARPTKWGNPDKVGDPHPLTGHPMGAEEVVQRYPYTTSRILGEARDELAGKDLACWCPLDQPCHADVLLEWVNG